jgi:hypothetical protein
MYTVMQTSRVGDPEAHRMFKFHDPGQLVDGDLELVLAEMPSA